MRLTVVGCSGSTSGPTSPASCYLVQAPYQGRIFSLLLDLGPGSFGHLYHYLDPSEVDAIGLSHLHPDHCLDVCGFYVAARYSRPGSPWPGIPLYGPQGTRARIQSAYEVAGAGGEPGPGIGDHFDHHTWQAEQQVGPFRVLTDRVAHPVEAYAIRVVQDRPDGGTLVFSGDTGPCPALVELARGADLLLAEASFLDGAVNPPGVHLTGRQAAEIAHQGQVGELVLTHIPPWHPPDRVLAQARPHFAGPVTLAEPGGSFPVGPR